MRIQHNIMAMSAYRNYSNNTSALSKNLEKLSSGYKINRAGDDAAGLAISEKMRAQITGLNAAQKNVKDGISLVKTAEGAMQEIQDMLNRMDYLATQSANGTYQDEVDREALQKEVNQLREEINRIADSANFNGIKLLDGSLSTSGVAGANDVKVSGNAIGYYSVGSAGVYDVVDAIKTTGAADSTGAAAMAKEGDSFQYTVSLENGKSYSVNLTLAKDADGKLTKLVADDGTKYNIPELKTGSVKVPELSKAVLGELQKTGLADNYVITAGAGGDGTFKFTAKEVGTNVPAVASADAAFTFKESGERVGVAGTTNKLGVTVTTPARDVGYEITASELTEYDGTNYDDAVFTINGKKFVLLTEDHTGANLDQDPNDASMHAALGLGSDVTILVGGTDGLTKANANFNQNINKIADATGLTVGDAITEAGGNTGTAAGAGIRLSAGKGSLTGGLTLQIGDTADSFNQLRVSIGDMHTKALGIADLNISNQSDAAAAIDTIKDAINQVSSVRGDLGAYQNRLEHTQNNLSVMAENIQDAESNIRDTDVAEEMMAYTKNNILVQSAQAMLAQANQVPQGVLQLLG